MQTREKFSSRLGFILMSAGCAIGLGNVYRFPITVGAHGGALFVFLYIMFLMLLGFPVLCAELAVGRASGRSMAESFRVLEKPGQKWHLVKYLSIGGNYLLMMFYTTISAWLIMYFFKYADGSILSASGAELENVFDSAVASTPLVGLLVCGIIVAGFGMCSAGLKNCVERLAKWMMIALLGLLIVIAVYCCTLPGAGAGVRFYLMPSPEALDMNHLPSTITAAMEQAFFTLSLGLGSISVFGSYIGKERSLPGEALTIAGLDTFVALCSGFIVFPACFTYNGGVTADAGTVSSSFLFTTLSGMFNAMPGGRIVGALFFLCMIFAAMSTVIAVFENLMSFWLDQTALSRRRVALINTALLIALSAPSVLSCGPWDGIRVLGMSLMDFEDYIVSNVMLPVGGLIYILFCTSRYGWGWNSFRAELNTGSGLKLPGWLRGYMTWTLPVIIIVLILINVS